MRASIIAEVACSVTSYSKGAIFHGRVRAAIIAGVTCSATSYSKGANIHGRVRAAITIGAYNTFDFTCNNTSNSKLYPYNHHCPTNLLHNKA
jgi:hypothetical protein